MKHIFSSSLCLVTVLLFSFTPGRQKKENALSAKEKKAGWILLFDGKTKDGWRGYQNRAAEGWEVIDGQLVCKEGKVNSRADLITVNQYENFELKIDWKIEKARNSGIIYRVTEGKGASDDSGPEYQLIDDEGYPEKLKDVQYSGANYDMNAPVRKVAKKAGEYNHTRIIVNKGHVEHWLNGVKVVEYELWSPAWEKDKAGSKWKDLKTYGMTRKGYIALQDHGGGVSFKNIKLRVL